MRNITIRAYASGLPSRSTRRHAPASRTSVSWTRSSATWALLVSAYACRISAGRLPRTNCSKVDAITAELSSRYAVLSTPHTPPAVALLQSLDFERTRIPSVASMRTVELGGTGEQVSQLALGCMLMGTTTDEPTSYRMLDHYLDAGGAFLDTA